MITKVISNVEDHHIPAEWTPTTHPNICRRRGYCMSFPLTQFKIRISICAAVLVRVIICPTFEKELILYLCLKL